VIHGPEINNSCAHGEQGNNPGQKKEFLMVSSINGLLVTPLSDLAGHWLAQHTVPVRAKPDSRPRLEAR